MLVYTIYIYIPTQRIVIKIFTINGHHSSLTFPNQIKHTRAQKIIKHIYYIWSADKL